jgi:hypothetical protein
MADGGVPASFQDIDKAAEVAFHIGVRIADRIAYAGLRREIDDNLRRGRKKECRNTISLREIGMLETKVRKPFQPLETSLLQADVLIFVHGVEADNLAAFGKQPQAKMKSYEPGCAGDQYRPA